MKQQKIGWFRPSVTLTATALTQLLAALACFLGNFVLPRTLVEFNGINRSLLLILGSFMLLVGLTNLLYGRHFARILTRVGKRSRVVIPREGFGYLAIMLTLAVGGLLGQSNMPLLVFGMMAGPFILNGAIVYQMLYGIAVERTLPRRAVCGDFVTVELCVTNRKSILASHMLEVRDRIESAQGNVTGRDEEGSVTFVRIPARQSRVGRYQVAFRDRGRYSIGPIRVSSRFPLGIGERGQLFNNTAELIVHPRLGQLLPQWERRQKELAESSHNTRSLTGLFDDEFHRIREYRAGDNPRSIHWRSTARQGTLMIREFEQRRHNDAIVVLDLPMMSDWSDEDLERSVSLVATICVVQTQSASGGRFVLAIAAKQPLIIASRSPAAFREQALDALATCQPSAKSDLQRTLQQLVQDEPVGDGRLIIVTPSPEKTRTVLNGLAEICQPGQQDLSVRSTIVEATAEKLNSVFRFNDEPAGEPHPEIRAVESLQETAS